MRRPPAVAAAFQHRAADCGGSACEIHAGRLRALHHAPLPDAGHGAERAGEAKADVRCWFRSRRELEGRVGHARQDGRAIGSTTSGSERAGEMRMRSCGMRGQQLEACASAVRRSRGSQLDAAALRRQEEGGPT